MSVAMLAQVGQPLAARLGVIRAISAQMRARRDLGRLCRAGDEAPWRQRPGQRP